MHCSVAELRELVAVYRRSCHCDREQIGEAFVSCGDCPRDYAKFKPMPEDEAREVDESVRAGITVYSDEPQPAPQGEPVAWRRRHPRCNCAKAEREACAKLAEKLGLITDDSGRVRLGDVDCIAATIRAR